MHFTFEFLLSGSKSIPACQRLHQAMEEGGGRWWGQVGGVPPDIMDPRPENLKPGVSTDETKGGAHGGPLYGK